MRALSIVINSPDRFISILDRIAANAAKAVALQDKLND
jgi:hypothetical protein